MVDCGEGTQLQCKRFGIKLSRIDHILISHLHGDHYYGLVGLLSTMHLYGRQKPLVLVGPPGLMEIITLQLRHSETTLKFDVDFTEWIPGERQHVFENSMLDIHTIPLDHQISCSGYLFREKPKKRRINRDALDERLPHSDIIRLKDGEDIYDEHGTLRYRSTEVTLPPAKRHAYAYCSDTRYKRDILQDVMDADIMYHEATFMEDMKERAHDTYHTTAAQAAELARDANVGKLVLGHFSTRYKQLDPVLDEARAVFKNSYLGIEGQDFRPLN